MLADYGTGWATERERTGSKNDASNIVISHSHGVSCVGNYSITVISQSRLPSSMAKPVTFWKETVTIPLAETRA